MLEIADFRKQLGRCIEFAAARYRGHKVLLGEPLYEFVSRSTDLAVGLLTEHLKRTQSVILPIHRKQIEILELAGWLQAAICRGGATFEEVSELTNFDVANVVVVVSPDGRLPEPRRIQEQRSSLVEAPFSAQLLQMAIIELGLQTYQEAVQQTPVGCDTMFVRHWGDMQHVLLQAMGEAAQSGVGKAQLELLRKGLKTLEQTATKAKQVATFTASLTKKKELAAAAEQAAYQGVAKASKNGDGHDT